MQFALLLCSSCGLDDIILAACRGVIAIENCLHYILDNFSPICFFKRLISALLPYCSMVCTYPNGSLVTNRSL